MNTYGAHTVSEIVDHFAISGRGLMYAWPFGNTWKYGMLQCPCFVILILFWVYVKCLGPKHLLDAVRMICTDKSGS